MIFHINFEYALLEKEFAVECGEFRIAYLREGG